MKGFTMSDDWRKYSEVFNDMLGNDYDSYPHFYKGFKSPEDALSAHPACSRLFKQYPSDIIDDDEAQCFIDYIENVWYPHFTKLDTQHHLALGTAFDGFFSLRQVNLKHNELLAKEAKELPDLGFPDLLKAVAKEPYNTLVKEEAVSAYAVERYIADTFIPALLQSNVTFKLPDKHNYSSYEVRFLKEPCKYLLTFFYDKIVWVAHIEPYVKFENYFAVDFVEVLLKDTTTYGYYRGNQGLELYISIKEAFGYLCP